MPKKGYGQMKRLSEFLRVSTTYISQVFHGEKSLNLEQGAMVCEFLELNELEIEYFLKLILIERAGTEKLKKIHLKEADKIKKIASKIKNRMSEAKTLSDEDKLIFYSDWYMSAIRLLTAIKGHQDIESISNYLNLPQNTVSNSIDF